MNSPASRPSDAAAQRYLALNRRQFLRGLGACVALPVFESALRPVVRAATAPAAAGGLGVTSSGAPLRMAFVYFPNGAHQANWWPTGEGASFKLGKTMQPLAPLQQSIQVLGGLDHKNATAGNDGAGDHARANATFLTGARARKTDSTDIQVGISVDQIVAQKMGHLTRFSSLELSCDSVRKSGRCDSGYSCAYQYNLSWASPTTPVAPESNPRLVFERLFGTGAPGERQSNFRMRQETQKSLLDFVMEDARSLQRQLGRNDQEKLDEYLTGLREIEQRIQRTERFGDLPNPHADTPAGIPPNFGDHMDVMFDLLAMAFETDSTRVSTLLLAGDGSNRAYPQIGIPEGHHYCSHHRNNDELMEKIGKIDLYYMERFARFLRKLEEKKDVDGRSILHNSMIVYGCGNSDGNRHTHDNLPIVLAGGGGGTFNAGRYSQLGSKPMSNLFLSMTDRMGVKGLERIGDSSGRVTAV
ncbi:DUF1552 domain-containing protein [Horticoccus sp. 23ND18S-11]|uniref:DUF1552 domain-containing protein n=1 Tax=Horticoccus sp. 23ND18S-11 TaxID=3391832 RepID=UPI0039C8E3D0